MLAIRIAATTRLCFVCANRAMQLPVLPLLAAPLATQPLAWRHGRPVDRPTFVAQVLATAKHLPQPWQRLRSIAMAHRLAVRGLAGADSIPGI